MVVVVVVVAVPCVLGVAPSCVEVVVVAAVIVACDNFVCPAAELVVFPAS